MVATWSTTFSIGIVFAGVDGYKQTTRPLTFVSGGAEKGYLNSYSCYKQIVVNLMIRARQPADKCEREHVFTMYTMEIKLFRKYYETGLCTQGVTVGFLLERDEPREKKRSISFGV